MAVISESPTAAGSVAASVGNGLGRGGERGRADQTERPPHSHLLPLESRHSSEVSGDGADSAATGAVEEAGWVHRIVLSESE